MISKREILMGAGLALLGMAAPVQAGVISVPFVMGPDRKPVTGLSIGGKGPYIFVIDTGASTSCMRDSLAKALHLREVARQGSQSLGGRSQNFVYEARNVVFANTFKIPGMAFVGMQDFPIEYADGLLAAGFLTGVQTQLDFETLEVRFYPEGTPMDLAGFQKLSSHRDTDGSASEKIYVDATIDGNKINCLLDTGASPALYLAGHYVKAHKLWDAYPDAQERMVKGANGDTVKTRFTHAQSLDVGGFAVAGAPLTLGDPKEGDGLMFMDGILGMGVIGRFTLAFAKDGLYVKPNRYFDNPAALFAKPKA